MTQQKRGKTSGRLQNAVLEILVPCAMALSAMAFAAGLYVQGGFGLVSSLIAGVTLFLVMICSQAAYVSSQRAAQAVERLNELETAVQIGSDDDDASERLAHLSDKIGQIDGLSARMGQLDELAERIDHLHHEISHSRPGRSDIDPGRVQRLAAEVERLDARQEALRSQLQIESRERHEHLTSEIKMLETLVKQMAENIANSQRVTVEHQPRQELPPPREKQPSAEGTEEDIQPKQVSEAEPDPEEQPQEQVEQEPVPAPAPSVSVKETSEPQQEPEPEPEQEREASLEPPIDEIPLIDEVRQSIESNRIELHLQPIMTLPQRRVRYYEALTRLRNEAGDLLMPSEYMGLAESAGIMSVIDNVMLYRSVQVLRRLEKRSSARGVFCNISLHSLLDPEFFPEFISFMEQNRSLSESMYFEFSQEMIEHAGPVEQESLDTLAELGFRFSLDQVSDLDLDFQAMQARGFRFIKVDAGVLLHGMKEARAQIHAADMRSYLERFGIQLIVSRIETEQELASLLDYQVRLGQGYVFSEPRPVRPEIFAAAKSEQAA